MIETIANLDVQRTDKNLGRRAIKGLEEIGELSECYLSLTSPANYKNKTWDDFREEAVDILTNVIEVGITLIPDMTWPRMRPVMLIQDQLEDYIGRTIPVFNLALANPTASGASHVVERSFVAAWSLAMYQVNDFDAVQEIFDAKIAKWQRQIEEGKRTDLVA